jgi:hypothetical protein
MPTDTSSKVGTRVKAISMRNLFGDGQMRNPGKQQ